MSKRPAVFSILSRLRAAVTGKEFMGKDAFGNSFYRRSETDSYGLTREKRIMEAAGGGSYAAYDPSAISPLWRQWLSKTRKDAPTDEEMQKEEERVAQMTARVMQLEAEQRQQDLRAQAEGRERSTAQGPDLDRFIGQLSGKGSGRQANNSRTRQPEQQSENRSSSDNFEPETWKPGA